ncbi:MAG: fibronectin type III domain-containing protein, partial [Chloroflexi bacterium]|nr:fibronectin type III domain-containing protein [Chloroflexota bacterium]
MPTATSPVVETATQTGLRRLPAPENFRVLSGKTVAWDAVEGADRYRVRLDPPNAERILKRVNPPQTQYTFENLQVGLVYRVRVRAMGDEVVYQLLGDWSETLELRPGATAEPTATEAATSTATAHPGNRPTRSVTSTPTENGIPPSPGTAAVSSV